MTVILRVVLRLSAPHMILRALGIDARVVDMPAGEDPNSFLKDHTREDFQQLLDTSLPPFDLEIRQIGSVEAREDQLKRIRDDLLPKVKRADPIMQPELIKKIHDELGVPVKALNEQLKRIRGRSWNRRIPSKRLLKSAHSGLSTRLWIWSTAP